MARSSWLTEGMSTSSAVSIEQVGHPTLTPWLAQDLVQVLAFAGLVAAKT